MCLLFGKNLISGFKNLFNVTIATIINSLKVSMTASHTIGRGFTSQWGHTKDHHENGTNFLPVLHACIRVRV